MNPIQNFTEKLQTLITERYKDFPNIPSEQRDKINTQKGRKYIKVLSGNAVYCFIENSTGNIWKPKDWRGPIKNVKRGNIHDENPLAWCGPYGIISAK